MQNELEPTGTGNWALSAIVIVLLAALGLAIAMACCGCRNKTAWRVEYLQGEVASVTYSQDTGWAFWSEGDGKVIDILDVHVSGASLK